MPDISPFMKDSVVFVTRLKSNAVVAHGPKRSGRKAHCRPVQGALAARAVFQVDQAKAQG
jgi:hypothetical protein